MCEPYLRRKGILWDAPETLLATRCTRRWAIGCLWTLSGENRVMLLGSLKWIVLPLAAACAFAQTKHTRIDVQKYTIDAEINPRTQAITATAKIDFTPAEAGTEIAFELNNGLTVSKAVDAHGQTLSTTRNAPDFTVTVVSAAPLQKGQPTQFTLSYEGKLSGSEDSPISGIKFAAL